jgi:hypothetical protein
MADLEHPTVIFGVALALMILAAYCGGVARRRHISSGVHEDVGVLLTATLTLLGLLIGFTFSMGSARYDQRKNFEEAEANAIGTEYLRVELLPSSDAARLKALLEKYLDQRILWYDANPIQPLQPIDDEIARLQRELWEGVRPTAAEHQTPINSLVAAGMNDVLNSQGYTLAAWVNRIPIAAWLLLLIIGTISSFLYAYNSSREGNVWLRLGALPLMVAIAFFLVADIDSPRGGLIQVKPQNLVTLQASFHGGP